MIGSWRILAVFGVAIRGGAPFPHAAHEFTHDSRLIYTWFMPDSHPIHTRFIPSIVRFMAKTVSEEEARTTRRTLRAYHAYVAQVLAVHPICT